MIEDPETKQRRPSRVSPFSRRVNGVSACPKPTRPDDPRIVQVILIPFRCNVPVSDLCLRSKEPFPWNDTAMLAAREVRHQTDKLRAGCTDAQNKLLDILYTLNARDEDMEEAHRGKRAAIGSDVPSDSYDADGDSNTTKLTLTKVLLNFDKLGAPAYDLMNAIQRLEGPRGLAAQLENMATDLTSTTAGVQAIARAAIEHLVPRAMAMVNRGRQHLHELNQVLALFQRRAISRKWPVGLAWNEIFEACLKEEDDESEVNTFSPTIRKPGSGELPLTPPKDDENDGDDKPPTPIVPMAQNGWFIEVGAEREGSMRRNSTLNPVANDFVVEPLYDRAQDLDFVYGKNAPRFTGAYNMPQEADCAICGDICFCRKLAESTERLNLDEVTFNL